MSISFTGNATECAYNKPGPPPSTLMVVAYVMIGLCLLCFLPVMFMIIHWQITRCRQQSAPSNMDDVGGLLQEDGSR